MTRWIIAALLGSLWLLIAIGNAKSLIEARLRGGTTSLTLFLGGFAGIAAVLTCPVPGIWIWLWVPALLDPGSLPALFSIVHSIHRQRKAENNTTTKGSSADIRSPNHVARKQREE